MHFHKCYWKYTNSVLSILYLINSFVKILGWKIVGRSGVEPQTLALDLITFMIVKRFILLWASKFTFKDLYNKGPTKSFPHLKNWIFLIFCILKKGLHLFWRPPTHYECSFRSFKKLIENNYQLGLTVSKVISLA